MNIRCLAIDDEPMALEKLKSYIDKVPYLELVAACECPSDAMEYMKDNEVDALFVDINMPDINGMEFVKGLSGSQMVVFTTAYSDYAAESYKVRAVDYILKPYTFVDFQKAAQSLLQCWKARQQDEKAAGMDDNIFLKVDYRYVRVSLRDIVYIEGMNEYLKVHLISGDPLLVHTSFKQMNGHLPDNFLQIHRSYVINVNYIREVERSMVLLEGGKRISISDSNRDAFMAYLKARSISR
ncbi:MAG: response regulator transcription factor [Bacteroidales bacterium]|nr:response regulator transcription factor [Bacteroidales bacterium]